MITEIDSAKCTGCRLCVEFCPMDVLRLDTFREEIPLCQAGCPARVDIRGYIYLLSQGDFDGAIKLIREALPLPAVTGRVCLHPCESECARKEIDEAVNINSLERFVADYWLNEKADRLPRLYIAKVAIVGSGPAGLAVAYDLIKLGYAVTVFESMPALGGMLRYGIPEFRLPRNVLDAQINYIRDMGVEFKTDTTIGRELTIDDLKDMGYRAVILSIGAQLSSRLRIEGIELDGVQWGLDFLRDVVNHKRKVKIKDRVLVVGGSDVAMDVARTALRLGAKEVELVCLESAKEMPAHKEYIQQAIGEGININASWGPKRILGKDGKVTGAEFVRCTSVFDKENRFNPRFDERKIKSVDAGTVVFAIGRTVDLSFLPQKVKTVKGETIAVESVTLATTLPGVFACGDAVSGPTSVVKAIASGKTAAISVDRYLKGQDLKAEREKVVKTARRLPKEGIEVTARQVTPLLPVTQRRRNFREVKIGLSEEMTMREAQRCMTCGSKAYIAYPESCMTCYNCEQDCPLGAINVGPFRKSIPPLIKYPKNDISIL